MKLERQFIASKSQFKAFHSFFTKTFRIKLTMILPSILKSVRNGILYKY